MKKLINGVENVITNILRGVVATDPHVKADADLEVIHHKATKSNKVGLVPGGGLGHEPLYGGYVEHGTLDAIAVGEVFTSPTPEQVLLAIQRTDQGTGMLHTVKNHTGDVINFDMATGMADTGDIKMRSIVIADDVAMRDLFYTAGRRGADLTMLVEKIVGTAAEMGRDLDGCLVVAQKVCDRGRSMGMALISCTAPAVGHPTFDLLADEVEIGIGIHGEPRCERVKLENAEPIARCLVEPILEDCDSSGDLVIVLTNGTGDAPLLELYLVYAKVKALLDTEGIEMTRVLVDNYITSLDMAGCLATSLSADTELLELLDTPVDTVRLRWGIQVHE